MAKSGFTKGRKWLLIVLLLAVITAGGVFMFSMIGKSKEERRNREYEMSLVDTLKDTYGGIEEVRISSPEYASKPSDSWGADIIIHFSDGVSLKHVLAYNKETKEIRIGVYNEEDEKFEASLNSRKGRTTSHVKVRYSDGTEEEL